MRILFAIIFLFIIYFIWPANRISTKDDSILNIQIVIDTVIKGDTLKVVDSTIIKLNPRIFYLNKKQVSEELINKMGEKGLLINGKGYSDPRTAIRIYGEKARHGIIFFDSKQ